MKRKDILIILILLFIFVAVWVGANIYHSIISSTISETINQDISPISPDFDIKTINKLKERQKVNPSFDLENIIPTPTRLPIEILLPQSSSEGRKLLL